MVVDFEPLIGFNAGPVMAADGLGLLHVYGANYLNSDFVITDGHLVGDASSFLLAHLDFTRSDVFQPACVSDLADHLYPYSSEFNWIAIRNSLLPGGLITIQGKGLGPSPPWVSQTGSPLPYQVGQTQVTLDGNPIPLLYVSDTEIRAVVPYSQPGGTLSTLTIQNGSYHFADKFDVATVGASVFQRDSSGLAAALNEDGTPNSPSNPAARGSIISLFATGLGPLQSALPDNAWTPLDLSLHRSWSLSRSTFIRP